MSHPEKPFANDRHERVDHAIGGDTVARGKLNHALNLAPGSVSVDQLAALIDRTFQGDEGSRNETEQWFIDLRDHLIRGRELRDDLKSVAYVLTLRLATRKLESRYKDVQNDPASIASRVWEKKINSFVAGLEEGRYESVFQFIKWLDQASEYVILDLIRERKTAAHGTTDDEEAILNASFDPRPGDDQADEAERRREEHRSLLRSIFQSLRGHNDLFIILILNRFAGLGAADIGNIMAIEPRVVQNRLADAIRIIGEAVSGE